MYNTPIAGNGYCFAKIAKKIIMYDKNRIRFIRIINNLYLYYNYADNLLINSFNCRSKRRSCLISPLINTDIN